MGARLEAETNFPEMLPAASSEIFQDLGHVFILSVNE